MIVEVSVFCGNSTLPIHMNAHSLLSSANLKEQRVFSSVQTIENRVTEVVQLGRMEYIT